MASSSDHTLLGGDPHAPALITDRETISYADLDGRVARQAAVLSRYPAGSLFLGIRPDEAVIATYLASLASGRPVLLFDPLQDGDVTHAYAERYRPALILGLGESAAGYEPDSEPERTILVRRSAPAAVDFVNALLLGTSGSTGSPKFVRLSITAVLANANSIARTLSIAPDQRAPTSLPLFYSYGLSVLNSHLVAGAAAVLTDPGVTTRQFWTLFDAVGCTSFAGVPYTYQILRRMRFRVSDHPSLTTLTQAGGRLDVDTQQYFLDQIGKVDGRFFVMYGQTEATARMAVVPPDRLMDKLGSAGKALEPGHFTVSGPAGETSEPDIEGEVIFNGPNVMNGYAESHADLVRGDDLGGRLATGDRGRLDDDGFLWLTGREKRITKIFGIRVNLDDVENIIRSLGLVGACVAGDDKVMATVEGDVDLHAVRGQLAAALRVHHSGVRVRAVDALPLLPNGKVDYEALADAARSESSAGPER